MLPAGVDSSRHPPASAFGPGGMRNFSMSQRRFIGLSSGSSMNGVDAALVETEGTGLDLRPRCVRFLHQSYTRDLRDMLLRAGSANPLSLRQVAMLHRVLGENFAS